MERYILPTYCCLFVLLFVQICAAQPVVNIVSSNYPDNILQVPVYRDSGNIDVELSEVVANNQVEVRCRPVSLDAGITNVTFQTANVPVGQQSRAVSFNIIAAGHVVEIQCSGQSIGGTQFQTASSAGEKGYIQVTKRPTVSVCSDVVVLPLNPGSGRNVEVLLSESVINDPVTVNCSVVTSLRAGSTPMRLTFNAISAPVSARRINVSYVLDAVGDAVTVECWASSESGTTPDDNLQYTLNTSRGDTAVFMYEVPQATFIPASIQSLGQTTVARTISYLVLEKPATDLTEFHCSFHNTSFNMASACVGSLPMTSSIDLSAVTVDLITTNMTFETGDHYMPLIIQVNGSTTNRVQRLLHVVCCRQNVNPKYFMLSTTLSVWLDVYPSVQFNWNNVTDESEETSFSQFDSLCSCDLKTNLCDVGCCCDQDCTAAEKKTFPCIPGYFGDSTQPAIFEYGCQETWSNGDNYLAILCVVTENNPFLGLLYDTSPASAGDSVQFDSLQAGAPHYEYRENETRAFVEGDVTGSGYRDGVIVKTDRGVLSLPQGIGTSACALYAPVVFLRDFVTWCSTEFSESMCSEKSSWSALDYLVPRSTPLASCLTSPQVLNLNSRANSSAVPTHVAYYCVRDSSPFTTAVGKDWDSTRMDRSLFNTDEGTGDESGDLRCTFDDDISKPPTPEFNATSRKCSNVVLKVNYEIYWKGGKIVQLRASLTLGDISAPADKLIVAQRFSVKFTYLNEVDRTKLPFIQPEVEERSGNPGYVTGKKVIAKTVREQSGTPLVTTNETTLGQLALWSSSSQGLCAGARRSDVLFGVNSLGGCLLRLSLEDFTNCSFLREAVFRNQQNLVQATHVARRGNVSLNETKDWLPLLSDAALQSSNASVNDSAGSCDSIPSSLHYQILIREAGQYFGIAQMEIVGARVRYSLRSWTFQCINGICNSCKTTNTTGNNATAASNVTTQCTAASLQSFPVTSSVDFIVLSGEDRTRIKRSEDVRRTCYQDACAEEVFYPLLTSYDGESREVTIAYGLMLVAFLLLVVGTSTSVLHNMKTLVIG